MIPNGTIVFSPPSLKFRTAGFPQYGFKREVRRDLRRGNTPTYTRRKCERGKPVVLADMTAAAVPTRSRPEALGSPTGYVVRSDLGLLWPHPSHSWPPRDLCIRSRSTSGGEWVPNLSCPSVRACHPQYPGGSDRSLRLTPSCPRWPSPNLSWLGIHMLSARWFSRELRNEAVSGSLALRPARWLALHQQGRLRLSFRRPGHPEPTSVMTTREPVNSRDRTCTGKTDNRMGCKQISQIAQKRRDKKRFENQAELVYLPRCVGSEITSFALLFLRNLRNLWTNSFRFTASKVANVGTRTGLRSNRCGKL